MDKGVRAGQKIILTGWIGLDGMQVVMDKKERELRERFSRAFLAEIKEQADRVPACPAEEMEALTGETAAPGGRRRDLRSPLGSGERGKDGPSCGSEEIPGAAGDH